MASQIIGVLEGKTSRIHFKAPRRLTKAFLALGGISGGVDHRRSVMRFSHIA